jgi:hypothetical protein
MDEAIQQSYAVDYTDCQMILIRSGGIAMQYL